MMIGTELLLGQIDDTNATFMARVLMDNGINLYQKTTVGDNTERIQEALRAALGRSDVVICSGGLGPTEDDITRKVIARALSRRLALNESVLAEIRVIGGDDFTGDRDGNLHRQFALDLAEAHGATHALHVRGVETAITQAVFELDPFGL